MFESHFVIPGSGRPGRYQRRRTLGKRVGLLGQSGPWAVPCQVHRRLRLDVCLEAVVVVEEVEWPADLGREAERVPVV